MTPESNFSMASLAGPQPPMAAQSEVADAVAGIMSQMRQMTMTIDAIAKSAPEAGPELSAAKEALTAAVLKIVGTQRQPQAAPPIAGA